MRTIIAITSLICVALGPVPASAGPRSETVGTTVRHGDLDLGTQAGLRELDLRIRRAASALCQRQRSYNGLPSRLPDGACLREALAGAQAQVADLTGRPAAGASQSAAAGRRPGD